MIIVSIKTMYCRIHMLKVNIKSILAQKDYFDKLVIVIDNNLTEEQYKEYYEFEKLDDKISILKEDEHKWRSCNKLLPVMKRYPNDDIITLDDDTYYPIETLKLLIEKHKEFPNIIITHLASQLFFTKLESFPHFIGYLYSIGVNINSITYNKYLSNATLFPAHTFDNTDIWNYDKMYELTEGVHDELWFWINSTKKGIPCYQLDYTVYFTDDMKIQWKDDDYRLAYEIIGVDKVKKFSLRINLLYYNDIINKIWNFKPKIYISNINMYNFICYANEIIKYYPMGIDIYLDKDMTISNKKYIMKIISSYKPLFDIVSHIYDENNDIKNKIVLCETEEQYMILRKKHLIDF